MAMWVGRRTGSEFESCVGEVQICMFRSAVSPLYYLCSLEKQNF